MIALVALAAAATSPPEACPIERAQYVLRANHAFTANFHQIPANSDWPSGLALEIRSKATGRQYWALPWNGGTDGRQHVRWIRVRGDNLPMDSARSGSDSDFLATDRSYAFTASVPKLGDTALAHFVLPFLGGAIWHSTNSSQRDSLPQSFFDLAGCTRGNARVAVDLPSVP